MENENTIGSQRLFSVVTLIEGGRYPLASSEKRASDNKKVTLKRNALVGIVSKDRRVVGVHLLDGPPRSKNKPDEIKLPVDTLCKRVEDNIGRWRK